MMPPGMGSLENLHTALSVDIYARNLTGEGVAAARTELESLGALPPDAKVREQIVAQEQQRARIREQVMREHPEWSMPYGGAASGTLTAEEERLIKQKVATEQKVRAQATVSAAEQQARVQAAVAAGDTAAARASVSGMAGLTGLGSMGALSAEQRAEVARIQSGMRATMADARAAIIGQMTGLSQELKLATAGPLSRAELSGELTTFRSEMSGLRSQLATNLTLLRSEAQGQIRSIVDEANTQAALARGSLGGRGGGGIGSAFVGGLFGGGGTPTGAGATIARGAGMGLAGVAIGAAGIQLYGGYQAMGLEYAITAGLAQGLPQGDQPKAVAALYPQYRQAIPPMLAQYGITDWNAGAGTIFNVLSRPGMAPQGSAQQRKLMYDETMHIMKNAAMMQTFTSTSANPLSMDEASQAIMMLMVDTGTTQMAPGPAKDREIDRLTNILVAGHRFSAVPMENLLSGAGRSFAQLATMGFTPEELISGAAAMTQHGMQGTQAWTAMTMFATRLAKPTSVLGKGPEFASALGIENIRRHGLSDTLRRIVAISRDIYHRQHDLHETFYDATHKPLPLYQSPADIEMQLFGDIRGSQRTFSQLVGFGDTGAGSAATAAQGMQGTGYDPSAAGALDVAYGGPGGISPFFTQFQSIFRGVTTGAGQNSLAGYQAIISPTAEFQFHKMVADFKELADVMNGPLSGNMAGIFKNIDGLLNNISAFEKQHHTMGGIVNDALFGVGALAGGSILQRVLLGTENEHTLTAGFARAIGAVMKGVPAATRTIVMGMGENMATDAAAGFSSRAAVAAMSGAVAGDMAAAGATGTTAAVAATGLGTTLAGAMAAGIAVTLPVLVGLALGKALEEASNQIGDWERAHEAAQKRALDASTAQHAAAAATLRVAQSGGAHAYAQARQTDLTRIFGGRGPLAARYAWNQENLLGDQSLAMAHMLTTWGMSHPGSVHDQRAISAQISGMLSRNPKAMQDVLVGFYEHQHGVQAPMRGTKAFTDLVASPDFQKWFGSAENNKRLIANLSRDLATEFARYWPHSPAEAGPLSKTPDMVAWFKGADWQKTLNDLASAGNDAAAAVVGGTGSDSTGGLGAFLPPGGVPHGSPGSAAAAHRVLAGRRGQGGGYWQYASFGSTLVDPMLMRRVRSGLAYLPDPHITGMEQSFAYDLYSGGDMGMAGGAPYAGGVLPSGALSGRSSASGTAATGGTALAHLKAIADATTMMARGKARPPQGIPAVHVHVGAGAGGGTRAEGLRSRGIVISK